MYFCYLVIFPFGKGQVLHLNKCEFPSSMDDLCQVWLKLDQWFWRRWKCEKFTATTITTTTTTENGQIMIRKAHLSLRLRWAKNNRSTGNIGHSKQLLTKNMFRFSMHHGSDFFLKVTTTILWLCNSYFC